MVSSRAVSICVQVLLSGLILAVPSCFGDFTAYQIGLYLLLGIATQSVAFCWGQAGFLSLGQAVFFGLGAYLAGAVLKAAVDQPWLLGGLALCLLVPALLAYVIARAVFARLVNNAAFFSLITLALAMLAALLANRFTALTGGFNGMTGIPDLPGTERYSTLYYVIAVAAIGSTLMFNRLLKSPLGILLKAVEQNEERLQFFAFDTGRLKAVALAIAAAAAGLAGLLYAPHEGIVTPNAVGISLSTQFVIWAAIGGRRSPLGALAATVLIGLVSAALRDRYPFWESLMALMFIAAVLWFSDGIAGAVQRLWLRLRPRWVPAVPARVLIDAPAGFRRAATDGAASGAAMELCFDAAVVQRGSVAILNGLELIANRAGISCVIGPNGAGKTSMFNALTGRLPINSGGIFLNKEDISDYPVWRIARLGIARKFQIPSLFAQLTVRQNLLIALWANRLQWTDWLRRDALDWISPFATALLARMPVIAGQQDVAAGSLSQGARQMLEFSMVALMEPGLLLLDEPCAGLSPAETRQMMDSIIWAVDTLGASALLIEHDMSAVEAIGGHVFVLHQGQLLAQGSLLAIKTSSQVREVYIGGRK